VAKSKDAGQAYQLKITLQRITPPVWRQVKVKDCTLAKLHTIVQWCMGWHDCHVHQFDIGSQTYGDPRQWFDEIASGLEVGNERKVKLSQLARQGIEKFTYIYDLGDSWTHLIQIEKVLPAEKGAQYPQCLAGERACPPEDCGGAWGYGDFVQAIKDPGHARHEELTEWLGTDFDPEAFDIGAVNGRLR
jgi:hypothetical protein